MDKNHKEKGYIYLKHILDYLNIENEIKEEYHKYNFISVKNKNCIYININENYANLYEFFNTIIKKNNLYITLNEFVYFFSQDEKLKKYNFRKKDVIELYYSILFYAYYNNKNKKLLNILQSLDNPKNDGINTVSNNNVVEKETDNKKELDKNEDENNEYNLHLYKGYFTLNDFNFVVELKDLYSYFEGSECPYTKIKRRIIEIYGTLKNGVLINSEMCNNNDDDDNLENSDADLKDLGIELNEDSFKIFMKEKYKYMHHSKLSLYRKKTDSNKIVQKINKKTFMCLMYNIGIHMNHCLILWNNFIQFLEGDLLDYKILSAFLNGEINISNNGTEQDINYIKNKIMNNNIEVEEFSRNNKHRLDGTICSRLFKNTQKLYSTHTLTFDEIEVLSKVLTNVHPFKYLDKNEKKQFINNLKKHCYKKGHIFESIKKEGNVKNNEKVCNKEKKNSENYMDTEIIILLNGILKNTKENNSFINSVNVIEKYNLKFYTAHTNVAIVEINGNIYTEDFINLVNNKKEISNEFMNIVDNVPIFKNFTYDLKNYISMNIKKCEYQNKQFIIRQHDDPLDFYILKDGEVNIYYNNADNVINTLSAYSFFGEISIIFNMLRTCNVAVKSDKAICYSISSEYFLSLLNKDIVKEFIMHSQINYNEESLNNAIMTYMNNQIQNNSNNIKDTNISIARLNMAPNTSVNTSMSNSWKNISRDHISNLTSSTTLSLDNIMLDTEYIDNKKYIRSFYSDLDKILLNNFNTEQKYLIEEMETNLMRVKVFKKIFSKMEKKDQFVKNLKYEKCPKGKHLILEGDKCEKFYFIKQGVVSIRQFNQYKNMYDEITTFKDNQYFGHQLILSKVPSIFIVVTVCNTELYTIDANLYIQFLSPFIGILGKSKDINELDILTESINNDAKIQKKDGDFITKAIHFLKKINIINKLNDDELYNSAKNIQFKFFKKGKVIIKYQDEPDFFYIIKKGIVSVKTDNGKKSISNESSLNLNSNIDSDKTNATESQNEEEHNMTKSVYLHKYEYFGELSIINNQLRTATCEAYTNCFLLAIDKISFKNYFNNIFNELLQEAEIKYTKNYSLPPWLKTIYGNENNYDNIKSFISINLPKLDSSLSSLSDRSSEEFEFEKDIKKKIKKAKKKEKEIKNKKTNKNRNDKTSEKDKVNTKRQNNNENSNKKKINKSTNDASHSKSNSSLLSLSIENVDQKIKEIEKEKDKKLEEMKLKELKVFEKIKLRDEKKVERIMKQKNKKKHKKNDVVKLGDNIEKKNEKINKKKNDHLAKKKGTKVENSQISEKVNLNDENNSTTLIKVNVLKETDNEKKKIKNNNNAEKKHILQTNQVEQKEGKNKLTPLISPKKSSSILKIRTNSSSSTDLDVKDLIQKLTNYIESEYSSIYQFYESIDKFNRGYIKYEDFLNSMNSINITNKIFDKEEKIENVFKYLCNDMNILTPNNFYISVYKHKSIDKYELNLRLCEIYSNSILGFKKNIALKTVDDVIINYEEFENVCNQIGLIDKDNIQNIWNEINIMNEENIPLDIILNIINGELDVEESYEIYNNKKSLLNQVVNFFQGNNAELIKMSTNVMEYNILTNYEDPVIINKAQHKSYPNECNHIVKQLELDPNFKILTLDQRKYFATLMDRKVSNFGDIITKQNSENSPIILLFEGTANLITYTIFGIETVVREIKNDEIYGSLEAIADSRSDYEVKINSNNAIIWILKREHYNEKIKPMLEERQQNCTHILQVLKNVPILRYLPLEILDNISYSMKIEIHEPNHTIIKEGDYDDKFYIICKGLATVDIPSKFSYNKLIISSLKKADYFGELSLINNTARTANVVLDTTSILFSLVSSEFNRLLSPYFDKFTNRAKANYKKIKIENSLPDTDIQIHNINQNYQNPSIYNRNRKTKVTIQDSNYLKNIENDLKQNIPKQNEPSKSKNIDNKIDT
ncbi:reticulocyte-binding protein 2 homolog A, putative [Plasmodium yoelii yoelii]|nr:reticulocyte-binding protein 2 homolog A, putative [Plasmodium yoelii yoelii]